MHETDFNVYTYFYGIMIDVLKLIRCVKAREPLWDRKHEYYHDRTITMTMWEDVAYTLGANSDSVRAKWKGLRDTFRGELKKLNKEKNKTSTNWEYFDEMLFVKDQIYSNKRLANEGGRVKLAPLITKLEESSQYSNNSKESNDSYHDGPSDRKTIKLVDLAALQVQPTIETNGNSSSPPEVAHGQADRPEFRRFPLDEDDDYNFLMSILPQLRVLPTNRNLFVRLKIQEMLYNEILNLNTNV